MPGTTEAEDVIAAAMFGWMTRAELVGGLIRLAGHQATCIFYGDVLCARNVDCWLVARPTGLDGAGEWEQPSLPLGVCAPF